MLFAAVVALGLCAPHAGPPIWTELLIEPDRIGFKVSGETLNLATCFGLESDLIGPLSAPEETQLREFFADYFREHALLSSNGLPLTPELVELDIPVEDAESDAPLVLTLRLDHSPVEEPPTRVSVRWDDFEGTTFMGTELVTVLVQVDGKPIEMVTVTPDEPEFVWHAPPQKRARRNPELVAGEISARRGVPVPSLVLGLLAVSSAALARRKRWPVRMALVAALAAGSFLARDLGRVHFGPAAPLVELPDEATAREMFSTLHRNIYRAFEASTEDEIYDLLSQSVAPEQLDDLYGEVYESLVMREQGGAVCSIDGVEVLKREIALPDTEGLAEFEASWHWRVHGLVAHWGHIHRRTNEYRATYRVRHDGESWKIADVNIHDHQRVESDG